MIIGPNVVIEDGKYAKKIINIEGFNYLFYVRCVHVHDNCSTWIQSQISCMGSKKHYWLGFNSWEMGKKYLLVYSWH